MKLKYNFVVREVANKTVAIPVGNSTEEFDCVITLNESGSFLFNLLKEDMSKEQLISAFLNEYDATREQAETTVEKFIEKLRKADILA